MKIKPYSDFSTQELNFTLNRALKSINTLKQSNVERAKCSISVLKDNIKAINEVLLKRD